jgi:hypothetical protein
MTTVTDRSDPEQPVTIDLRNPVVAALWAWLWPGAGHIYQRRYAKGILFMVCILGVYFFGFGLGQGRVVYASFQKPDFRYPYLLQIGVGIPAFPALVQYYRVKVEEREPLFGEWMAPPVNVVEQEADDLASWHKRLGRNFELGTLYTMIAGLLNVLVIFDAYGGPFTPGNPREEGGSRDKPSPLA